LIDDAWSLPNLMHHPLYYVVLVLGIAIFLVLVVVLSAYRYLKFRERNLLMVRHLAGFLVGLVDQALMVIFNFQTHFMLEVTLFDYATYTFWYLIMPVSRIAENATIYGPLWVVCSASINTIFEHLSWLFITKTMYGVAFLPYPTEPITWTSMHTVLFYIAMHTIATVIILIYYSSSLRRFSESANQFERCNDYKNTY